MELEEKFKTLEIVLYEHDLKPSDLIPSGKMTRYSAIECVKIAEDFAVDFAEWLDDNDFYIGSDNLWHKVNLGEDLTSKQLLELYKQHLKTKDNG